MLITKDYIASYYFNLIENLQFANNSRQQKADKLFRIKQLFPCWLRKIVFHPLNPLYSMFLQKKQYETRKGKEFIPFLNPYATDFFRYCLMHDVSFETLDYYPPQDIDTLIEYIDVRLKSCISGSYDFVISTKNQMLYQKIEELKANIKEKKDGFYYVRPEHEYYLPQNLYNEAVFVHEYGLKYLDDNVIKYISNKDFLDVGAFIGDSSILFEKKYNARSVFAYEPVSYSQKLLERTLDGNKSEVTHLVKKGIGDSHKFLDIFIDVDLLSSSSMNKELIGERNIKETIEITTIDAECKNRVVGLIKMDIEGSELSAIKGARETISRDKPVMLVSMYHTGRDFFEIPPLLKSYVSSYQFRFLDIGITSPLFEKILVAYPKIK